MNILSIHHGHDSSVALIKDGKVLFYSQEERFTGIKHCADLPIHALSRCFKECNISSTDIDFVVVPGLHQVPEIMKLFNVSSSEKFDINFSKPNLGNFIRRMALTGAGYLYNLSPADKLGFPVYQERYPLKKKARFIQVSHHLSHAAAAYYTSGFDRSMVVTADGSGDGISATIWITNGGKLYPITNIGRNGSLGFFYNIVTEALGWQISDGEGKTMGLAPYGNFKKTKGMLDFITPYYKDGQLVRPRTFGFPQYFRSDGLFHWHFSQSEEVKRLIDKYGNENIAAEAQRVLEEQILNFVIPWIKKLNMDKLAAAGGLFLNVKMNQRIWETGLLKDFYVYPDAGDSGITIGAALYTYHDICKKVYKDKKISNVYYGPQYSDEYIEKVLKNRNLNYRRYENKDQLVKTAAKMLSEGKIIGWFQGRMEAGPRALGNRSILMDPRKSENKDIINKRVKYREAFRPFCPSMTLEAAKRYLINPVSAGFMVISFDVTKDRAQEIPAVVHVDNTARPQIVTKASNPLYLKLIEEFGSLTKVPVLLNTSFNIRGQPIVENPETAIKCFYDTGLDYLVIGSFILGKTNNWNKSYP